MRIAISTGGGDAPGLNAVIRAAALSAHDRGWKCLRHPARLRRPALLQRRRAARSRRGARDHPPGRHHPRHHQPRQSLPLRHAATTTGEEFECDRSDELVAAFQASGFDALVSIGGDGSLADLARLWRKGMPVVCVPKTIDNDVSGTQRTFGFDTAVSTATEAIDKLHSTAESHDRVIVVELMGRYAGWIALYSGLSGSADVILIPEIPFDIEKVCEKIRSARRPGATSASWWWPRARGRGTARSSCSSAAASAPWTASAASRARWRGRSSITPARRRGPWSWATCSAAARPRRTTACSRSGSGPRRCGPSRDRAFGDHGRAQRSRHHAACRWRTSSGAPKNVPLDSDTIRTARDLGISLGD